MRFFSRNYTKGTILYIDGYRLLKSIGNKLYKSIDNGVVWSLINSVGSTDFKHQLIYKSHLLSRLLRKGIHHASTFADEKFGVIVDKHAGIVDNESVNIIPIKGSRPLSFEHIDGEIVFGEYRSNPERSEIGLFALSKNGVITQKLTFDDIRHIHGVYQDPYTQKIWISTGDDDNEAALYCCEKNYTNLQKVLKGSQQTRTIKLLFTEDHIYFGSDTPLEENYLYRMDKESKKVEKLTEVSSSVFHATKVSNWLFFSTAVEPSKVNKSKYAELWASPDGNRWKCILKFKKDIMSMKYFQYGQIFFPSGVSEDNYLWISPFATKHSNNSYKLSLSYIEDLFNKV